MLKYLKYLSFLDRFPDLKSCAEEIGWLLFRFWLIAAFAGNGIGCVLNRNTRILCKIIPETYGAHLSIFIEKAKAQKPKTFQYPLYIIALFIIVLVLLHFSHGFPYVWKILKTNKCGSISIWCKENISKKITYLYYLQDCLIGPCFCGNPGTNAVIEP